MLCRPVGYKVRTWRNHLHAAEERAGDPRVRVHPYMCALRDIQAHQHGPRPQHLLGCILVHCACTQKSFASVRPIKPAHPQHTMDDSWRVRLDSVLRDTHASLRSLRVCPVCMCGVLL